MNEDQVPASFVSDSFVPDHTDEHPESGYSQATHSFLENHPVLNWLIKGGPVPQTSTDKPLVGEGMQEIPGVKKAGSWVENKLVNTGNYYAGALGGGLKYLSDILATGFDPRTAGLGINPTRGRLMQGIEADKSALAEPAKMIMKPRLASEIVEPTNIDLTNKPDIFDHIPDVTGKTILNGERVRDLFKMEPKDALNKGLIERDNSQGTTGYRVVQHEVTPPVNIKPGFQDRKFQQSKPFDPKSVGFGDSPLKEEIPPANVNPETGEELPELPVHAAGHAANTAVGEQQSKARQAYEAARSLMSVDLPYTTSAAFRQASPFIGTKRWFQAWEKSAKSYGNQEFYDGLMQSIQDKPLVKSGYADEIGVRFTGLGDLSKREEVIRSNIIERLPWVKASNRSYTAFLNYIRSETLDDLVNTAKANGLDPEKNLVLGRQIADFINDATGRGSLKFMAGKRTVNIENSAKLLTDTLFSPRLMASRINMMNPSNYVFTEPMIRQQYLKGMLRSIGSWWGIASAVELAGLGSVNKDPNSADFGKIRIGDTRIDPGAGFQQYLVLGHRMMPQNNPLEGKIPDSGIAALDLPKNLLTTGGGGITSSVTGKFTPFGQGFKPETRGSTMLEFGANKLHPVLRFAVDLLRAQPNRQVNVGDRSIQLAAPIIAGDIIQLLKQDPSLIGLIGAGALAGTSGMGVQTYSRGKQQPTFLPEDYDLVVGKK